MFKSTSTTAAISSLFGGALLAALATTTHATDMNGGYSEVFAVNADATAGAREDWGGPAGYSFDISVDYSGVSQSGQTVVLYPQAVTCNSDANDKDTYWGCDGSGPADGYGGKFENRLVYEDSDLASVSTGVWQGCFASGGDLDEAYTVEAFVKILKADYSETWYFETDDSQCWSIPWTSEDTVAKKLQMGFILSGPNGLAGVDYGSQTAYIGLTSLPSDGPLVPSGKPNAVPVLPAGGVLGLVALMGYLVRRKLRA